MIAVILLIAFTVAIGGVISVWITGLTNTQTQQVSNQSSSQVKCTPSLIINRVDSNTAAATDLINVTVENPSQNQIININVSVVAGSAVTTNASVVPSLGSGTSYFITVGNYSTLPTLVRVSGVCSGLPVSFTCKPSDSCWRGT